MAFHQAMPWHSGEEEMHRLLRVPEQDNPTVPMLSPQAARMLQVAPLLAIGTVDEQGRPWTSLWGGEPGFSQGLGGSIVGVRTPVAAKWDPVVEVLVGKEATGEIVRESGSGRMVAGLAIDLWTRKRVKIYGRMVAGVLGSRVSDADGDDPKATGEGEGKAQGEIQLVVKIDQSLGNCPKYLNKKDIMPALTKPEIVSESTVLGSDAISLLEKADLFFLSTSHNAYDMDTNHRGGPPGLIRILSNTPESTVLVYPEYSGNRLYQSLGNILTNPKAGICIPDFETRSCLYATGTAEILVGAEAAQLLPKSNLAVKLTLISARLVSSVLPFCGISGESSPYNPNVRFLTTEKRAPAAQKTVSNTAKLLQQTPLTPTISRFRFALENAATYTAGQYVTLDCSAHLDFGYSHMRDDDPRSLNDDFVRTFTVSSPPGLPPVPSAKLADDEFEITIRKVGVVTDLLFKQGLGKARAGTEFEIEVKGFGGEFEVVVDDGVEKVGFVAAGVGITPLLPSLGTLDLERLELLWSMRKEDVGLAVDVLARHPDLRARTTLFLTGAQESSQRVKDHMDSLTEMQVMTVEKRMTKEDVERLQEVKRWYICTGSPQRKSVLDGLQGKEVIFEDFNF